MKVLDVIFDQQIDWTNQVNKAVSKVTRVTFGLRFLRKKLSNNSSLIQLQDNFMGLLYYGCKVWLCPHTRSSSNRKLNSVHYKAQTDWKKKRFQVDSIGCTRTRPFGKYPTT